MKAAGLGSYLSNWNNCFDCGGSLSYLTFAAVTIYMDVEHDKENIIHEVCLYLLTFDIFNGLYRAFVTFLRMNEETRFVMTMLILILE
jgi:hypothetical protein